MLSSRINERYFEEALARKQKRKVPAGVALVKTGELAELQLQDRGPRQYGEEICPAKEHFLTEEHWWS